MDLVKLDKNSKGRFVCPKCNGELRKVEGGGVKIVDGKVDMEATQPRHICDECGTFYKELLHSGYYNVFDLPENERKSKKNLVDVKDIPPQQIKRESDGKAPCPRCGDRMDFVPAEPVKIVDGKPADEDFCGCHVCGKEGMDGMNSLPFCSEPVFGQSKRVGMFDAWFFLQGKRGKFILRF